MPTGPIDESLDESMDESLDEQLANVILDVRAFIDINIAIENSLLS